MKEGSIVYPEFCNHLCEKNQKHHKTIIKAVMHEFWRHCVLS